MAATLIVPWGCVACGKNRMVGGLSLRYRRCPECGRYPAVTLRPNITTGYRWSPARLAGTIELLANKRETLESGKVGETGFKIFVQRAIKPGDSQLLLGYFRPYEQDKLPTKTFRVSLSIEARSEDF